MNRILNTHAVCAAGTRVKINNLKKFIRPIVRYGFILCSNRMNKSKLFYTLHYTDRFNRFSSTLGLYCCTKTFDWYNKIDYHYYIIFSGTYILIYYTQYATHIIRIRKTNHNNYQIPRAWKKDLCLFQCLILIRFYNISRKLVLYILVMSYYVQFKYLNIVINLLFILI